MMFESKQAKGRARVPSPPLRAEPADTAAPQQGRQSLIPLRRRQGLPETPRPLRRRSCLQETPGQNGNAAAMAAMSYSLHLARRRPRFLGRCQQPERRRRDSVVGWRSMHGVEAYTEAISRRRSSSAANFVVSWQDLASQLHSWQVMKARVCFPLCEKHKNCVDFGTPFQGNLNLKTLLRHK